jgi:hypothetical protein
MSIQFGLIETIATLYKISLKSFASSSGATITYQVGMLRLMPIL